MVRGSLHSYEPHDAAGEQIDAATNRVSALTRRREHRVQIDDREERRTDILAAAIDAVVHHHAHRMSRVGAEVRSYSIGLTPLLPCVAVGIRRDL